MYLFRRKKLRPRPQQFLNLLAAAGLALAVAASPAGKASGEAITEAGGGAREMSLFGMLEIRNEELAAFTKWTGMLARLSAENHLVSALDFVPAGNHMAELEAVNRMVNAVAYVPDEENWGAADHWATPGEFYSRNGDCEDFAIAKYIALKALGFDPADMRIVVLVDRQRRKHHAVLMIDTDMGRMILDNQIAQVVRDTDIKHYRPIYSINESAWWLHVAKPEKILLAQQNP